MAVDATANEETARAAFIDLTHARAWRADSSFVLVDRYEWLPRAANYRSRTSEMTCSNCRFVEGRCVLDRATTSIGAWGQAVCPQCCNINKSVRGEPTSTIRA